MINTMISLFAGHAKTEKLLEAANKEAGEITPQTLKKIFDDEKQVIVLDIRESE